MDISTQDYPWPSFELGHMEDQLALLHEFPEINCLEDIIPQDITAVLEANKLDTNSHHPRQQSLSSSTDSSATTLTSSNATFIASAGVATRTRKQPRLENSSATAKNPPYLPVILNFGSASSMPNDDFEMHQQQQEYMTPLTSNQLHDQEAREKKQRSLLLDTSSRNSAQSPAKRKSPSQIKPTTGSRDHIMAERRRREKITQHLIALSALLPDLKKMDKSSVLAEAVNYIKQLQEKVKALEEDNARKTLESTLLMQNSEITIEEDNISSSGDNEEPPKNHKQEAHYQDQSSSDVEVRVCNNNLLVKLQCERRETILLKILSVLEKLRLSVTTVHATPFGDRTLDVTIITQMDKETKLQSVVGYLSSLMKGF